MKLYHNNFYVKAIPNKFAVLKNATDYLDDLDYKRLSTTEREALNGQLLIHLLKEFIKDSKQNVLLKERLRGANPIVVVRIQTRSAHYFAVQFSNGIEIICEPGLFQLSPIKKRIKRLY